MKIATVVRTSMANALLTATAAGSIALPKIEIYTGTIPASIGLAITDTLLAEFEATATVGTVTDGILNFSTISEDPAVNANGAPGWARILDRDGAEVIYLTVGVQGSGAELTISSSPLQIGNPVSISSAAISVGA